MLNSTSNRKKNALGWLSFSCVIIILSASTGDTMQWGLFLMGIIGVICSVIRYRKA